MADVLRGGRDYQTVFNPEAYLKEYHKETSENWPFIVSYMESLRKIYSLGEVKGKRIIDIGCGPTIHCVIPAAKWFEEIFLADFSQTNLDVVQKWLARDSGSFNWRTHFEFFAGKDGDKNSWQKNADTLRAKIKRLLWCDFFQPNPLHPEHLGEFDAVTTCTTLMSGTTNVEQYTTAMKNISSLLKPGGYFIEVAGIECPFYVVGDEKFSCVSLTKADILTACKEANIDVLQTFDEHVPVDTEFYKYFGTFVVLGKKL